MSVYRELEAAKILYALLESRAKNPEMNISHAAMPGWHTHQRFIRARPYQHWFIVKADQLPAGSLYATRLNEIGIHLFPDHQRQGIGRAALELFIARNKPLPAVPAMRPARWLANINPENARSIEFFTKAGFRLKQHTYEL